MEELRQVNVLITGGNQRWFTKALWCQQIHLKVPLWQIKIAKGNCYLGLVSGSCKVVAGAGMKTVGFCLLTRREAQHFPPWLFLMHAYFRSTLWRNSGRHRPCRRFGHSVPLSCDLCGFCLSGTWKSTSTVGMVLNNTWKSLWICIWGSLHDTHAYEDISWLIILYYCFSMTYNVY